MMTSLANESDVSGEGDCMSGRKGCKFRTGESHVVMLAAPEGSSGRRQRGRKGQKGQTANLVKGALCQPSLGWTTTHLSHHPPVLHLDHSKFKLLEAMQHY